MKKFFAVALSMLIACSFSACGSSSESSADSSATTLAETTKAEEIVTSEITTSEVETTFDVAEETTEPIQFYSVGDSFDDVSKGVRFTVLSTEELSPDEFKRSEGNKVLKVYIKYENISDEDTNTGDNIEFISDAGETYTTDSDSETSKYVFANKLAPGEAVSGYKCCTYSESTSELLLEYESSAMALNDIDAVYFKLN